MSVTVLAERGARAAASAWPANADLHSHSSFSDGVLAPAAVVRRAHAQGVDLFALTDHDDVSGLDEAAREAAAVGMRFLAGVEISVSWAGRTVHVVGLGIDPADEALADGLAGVRAGRHERARLIGAALDAAGVPDAFEGARRFATNPALISRTHFARHIVASGVCANVSAVFGRFLAEGLPGYVAHRWAALEQAVGWIRGAGGTAVLAHPGRYRVSELERDALIGQFTDAGGEAIEVVSGSHTPAQYLEFARVALRHGLAASRGSDFHGPGEGRVDLGGLPPLPRKLAPVWHRWV
jgi:predicted metal-dependent phosphoesterase TrpH